MEWPTRWLNVPSTAACQVDLAPFVDGQYVLNFFFWSDFLLLDFLCFNPASLNASIPSYCKMPCSFTQARWGFPKNWTWYWKSNNSVAFHNFKTANIKLLLDIISSASLLLYLSMRSGNSICLKFWHIWKNLEIWVICNSAWPIWRNANSCPRELSHDMLARPFMIKFVIRIEQIIRSVWDYLLFFRVDFDGQIGI